MWPELGAAWTQDPPLEIFLGVLSTHRLPDVSAFLVIASGLAKAADNCASQTARKSTKAAEAAFTSGWTSYVMTRCREARKANFSVKALLT